MIGLAIFSGVASAAVHLTAFPAGLAATLCFSAVIAAALLISWGAEAAQFFMSQGLAVALIALLQVVPEFMVEAVIAWQAGKTGQLDLVFANASGSNRLLTGFGWPLIFFVTDFYHRRKHGRPLEALTLRGEHVVEVLALLLASSWYLVLIWKGTLSLLDSAVLGGGFALYLWTLNRLPCEDEEDMEDLIPPPRLLAETGASRGGRLVIYGLFLLGGGVMWAVAEPFLGAMKDVAVAVGVSEFAFVQWVAPFLTEFPEKVTAVYWSRTVRLAPMALLNMVSSTVNQFTALVAMIPIAFAVSAGHAQAIPMDPLHKTEVFLSFATTAYGVACLLKMRFTRVNAYVMLGLFLLQFFYKGPVDLFPHTDGFSGTAVSAHTLIAWAYLVAAAAEVVTHRREIRVPALLRGALESMR
ncbi:sodium/hydrogen exchanger [Anaeromyxobacter paludicola]|uniref:Sodium/hydrogen exchanger n=2 Tax=Anaeromyxobacter paludicola TaxID=2918171 RepID=A0ABN6NAI2_9BACT|nr:sodium/hydrogen exchanger [Anaeromyxobacter paludicola]